MATKKDRAEALARMTKAELIKTVKTLDSRITKLLNQLAKAQTYINTELPTGDLNEAALENATPLTVTHPPTFDTTEHRPGAARMPWEDALFDTTAYAPSSGQPIKRGE